MQTSAGGAPAFNVLRRRIVNANPLHVITSHSVWRKPAEDARLWFDLWPDETSFSHLEWESHTWPGGYEIHYIVQDGGVLCHQCANKELMRTIDPDDAQFYIVGADINYEDHVQCDHCGREVKPAYGYAEEDEACEEE
jgi:hypothetical protein